MGIGRYPLTDPNKIRSEIKESAPALWEAFENLAGGWLEPVLERLETPRSHAAYPKTFNDPIWGVIELMPWETILLDSPLLQRLRGVRQLGMAHLVYPGAGHDRLEHTRGVVEAAERMIRALERNADFRRRFGSDRDRNVPEVSTMDRCATRLAALLHDIGHGPFSHATEQLIEVHHWTDFEKVKSILRKHFEGVTSIAPAEVIAVMIVLSRTMRKVLTHAEFGTGVDRPSCLPQTIAARILGSRSCLDAGYLSGIISGPVDADKLDYIARDCHHSGLSLGIDLTRLIRKLEVVVVNEGNAPNADLRERALQSESGRFYDIGISQTGLGSYEQLIIARVLLYDRLYYHQKIRTAEAMLRCLIGLAEKERGQPFAIEEFFTGITDDIFVGTVGGIFRIKEFKGGGKRSRVFAGMLHDRRIHYRAFAFAARYLKGLGSLSDKEQRDTRARLWRKPLRELSSHAGCEAMAEKIFKKAKKLSENVPELTDFGRNLRREHILLDLPLNDAVVRGGDILTRTDGGHIGTPNLFFDPEKWSQAYEHQKQCGFVFTPRKHVPVVALASRIVFYESFRIVMDIQAERAAKVSNVVKDEWMVAARDAKFCSPECMEMLTNNSQSRFVRFQANDFEVPQGWSNHDPGIREHLANDLNTSLPSGLVASSHAAVAKAIGDFSSLVQMIEETGTFVGNTRPSESSAQRVIKQHLVSRGVDVAEGTEMAGGETDLVVYDKIVVEIKVSSKSNPFNGPPHASWQARRYSISLCTNVTFVVMVYRPGSEADLHMPPKRVGILELRDVPEERCEVRFAIPWGAGVPSAAKASPGSNIDKSLPDN